MYLVIHLSGDGAFANTSSPLTVLQNRNSGQRNCGVLGHCVALLVGPSNVQTSEIQILNPGMHDLPASQHQFLDVTKLFVTSKNWCWLASNF